MNTPKFGHLTEEEILEIVEELKKITEVKQE